MATHDPATTARLQRPLTALLPEGMERVTNPLLPPRGTMDRLGHFDPDVFDMSPESHLMRYLRVILGDAGVGQLHKFALLKRLDQTVQGIRFQDIDQFYGALFQIPRADTEALTLDPTRDLGTSSQWMIQHARDGSYRSRVTQFAHAVNHGPTILGLTLAVEALLNVDCELFEMWRYHDDPSLYTVNRGRTPSRREIVVRPTRQISLLEEYTLNKVLSRLTPADTLLTIDTTGLINQTEVPLRRVATSSEFWEVVTRVPDIRVGTATPYGTGSGDLVELPRPPLSGYQGEAWSYNADVTETNAYTSENPTPVNYAQIVFHDGSSTIYGPERALFSAQELITGRIASDGIAVINPYSGRRRSEPAADFYVDHISIDQLTTALRNQSNVQERPARNDFWATPIRPQSDERIEYLEIDFAEIKLINRIALDVAHFPHRASVQVFDEEVSDWVEVASQVTTSSLPARFTGRALNFRLHPNHYGPAHWRRFRAAFRPRRAQSVRIALQRGPGEPPIDEDKRVAPYSLGVRNMEMGYRVQSKADLPWVEDGDIIATSVDRLGSRVKFAYGENRVESVLVDDDTVWRSEPQVVKDAVVNLYVDTRDADGLPQTVHRFYLDPLTEGVSASLYYTDEEPTGDFDPSDDPIEVTETGVIDVRSSFLDFDDAAPAYLDIDGSSIEMDITRPWWFGTRLFAMAASDDLDYHPILSLGADELGFERFQSTAKMELDGTEESHASTPDENLLDTRQASFDNVAYSGTVAPEDRYEAWGTGGGDPAGALTAASPMLIDLTGTEVAGGLALGTSTKDWAEAPDHDRLDVTSGQLEVIVELDTDDIADIGSRYPVARRAAGGTGDARVWTLIGADDQSMVFGVYNAAGDTFQSVSHSIATLVSSGQRFLLRGRYDNDTGDLSLHVSVDGGQSWSGNTNAGAPGSLHAATSPLFVGNWGNGTAANNWNGTIYEVQVRNGIDGYLVANPKFHGSHLAPGVTSFTDRVGNVWTLNGNATIPSKSAEQTLWLPAQEGNYANVLDVNLLNADSAHVVQSLGGWAEFIGYPEGHVEHVTNGSPFGGYVHHVTDTGESTATMGIRLSSSETAPTAEGVKHSASVRVRTDAVVGALIDLFLEFWDSTGTRIKLQSIASDVPVGADWTEVSGTDPDLAPAGTVSVGLRIDSTRADGLWQVGESTDYSTVIIREGSDPTFVPSIRIVGDIDIRAKVMLERNGQTWNGLLTQWGDRFYWYIHDSANVRLGVKSEDGTTVTFQTWADFFPFGELTWVRTVGRPSGGADFYLSSSNADWGSPTTIDPTTTYTPNLVGNTLEIGHDGTFAPKGAYLAFEMRDGEDGPIVASTDFTDPAEVTGDNWTTPEGFQGSILRSGDATAELIDRDCWAFTGTEYLAMPNRVEFADMGTHFSVAGSERHRNTLSADWMGTRSANPNYGWDFTNLGGVTGRILANNALGTGSLQDTSPSDAIGAWRRSTWVAVRDGDSIEVAIDGESDGATSIADFGPTDESPSELRIGSDVNAAHRGTVEWAAIFRRVLTPTERDTLAAWDGSIETEPVWLRPLAVFYVNANDPLVKRYYHGDLSTNEVLNLATAPYGELGWNLLSDREAELIRSNEITPPVGSMAAMQQMTDAGTQPLGVISYPVGPVVQGQEYSASLSVASNHTSGDRNVTLELVWFDDEGGEVGRSGAGDAVVLGPNSWPVFERVSVSGIAPTGATQVAVESVSNAAGAKWAFDAAIIRQGPDVGYVPSLRVREDLDIRIRATFDRLGANENIISKGPDETGGWRLRKQDDDTIKWSIYDDASTETPGLFGAIGFNADEEVELRVTWVADTGLASYYVNGTLVNTATVATPMGVHEGVLKLGDLMQGAIHDAEVRDGIDGPILASPQFDENDAGTTEFEDAQGQTWTLNGNAEATGTTEHPALTYRTAAGDVVDVPTSFSANADLYVVLVHAPEATEDFEAGLTLMYRRAGVSTWEKTHLAPEGSLAPPDTIRVMGSIGTPADIGGHGLQALVLKEEEPSQADIDAFDGQPYINRPEFSLDPGTVLNSLLRIGTTLISDTSTYGVRGGIPDRFALAEWTPVARAYRLTKGMLSLPPVRARYWKFEFTNLAIEPYENFLRVEGNLMLHDASATRRYERTMEAREEYQHIEQIRPRDVNTQRREFLRLQNERRPGQPLPTALTVAKDHDGRSRLRHQSWLFGYINHHAPFDAAPTFETTGQHRYMSQSLQYDTKVAFFVGLRFLTAYVVDPLVEHDSYIYEERFHDDARLALNEWNFTETGMYAASTGNVAMSDAYLSETPVEALQFAATNSSPMQLLPDPGFDDEDYLSTTDWQDLSEWHEFGSAFLTYRANDRSVLVERTTHLTYGRIEQAYGEYTNIEPTEYGNLETESGGGNEGGIESPPVVLGSLPLRTFGDMETDYGTYGGVEPSLYGSLETKETTEHVGTGRIYAAARISVTENIEYPIWLQLVNQDGTVLSEQSILPTAGEISTLWIFHDYDTPPEEIRARVMQKVPSGEFFYVLNLSIFEPTVVWEFSVDGGANWYRGDGVANNPNGALRFPTPGKELRWRVTAYNPRSWVSALQIRPWYINMPREKAEAGVRGPDIAPFDDHPPIHFDPMFQQWSLPIPRWWYQSV